MNDVRTIEQRVRIEASPETVWAFWTDASKLCDWWAATAEVVAEPGGVFRVVMGDDGPTMRGEYVSLEPFTRLVFTFGWESGSGIDLVPPGSTMVEVLFTPIDDDTEVLLRHSELPVEQASEHDKGWSLFFGERLPAAVQAATSSA